MKYLDAISLVGNIIKKINEIKKRILFKKKPIYI